MSLPAALRAVLPRETAQAWSAIASLLPRGAYLAGGRLEIESRHPGTAVHVRLPVRRSAAESVLLPAPQQVAT